MDWTAILGVLGVGAMVVIVGPRLLQMAKHSPKGDAEDWKSAIIPLVAVVGFVILLMMMV